MTKIVDLLVIGGGLAGLAAAQRAAEAGASVIVVEKSSQLGGSAVHATFLWTVPNMDVMREINPGGVSELGVYLVEHFDSAVDWVRSLGVAVGDPVTVLRYGIGHNVDVGHVIARCADAVRGSSGCEVLLGSSPRRLIVEDGGVVGAEINTADGVRCIDARTTLLATGGFGGDPELRAQDIHPLARELPLRANRFSVGDGRRLGEAVGGVFGKQGAGFYGHLVPSHVRATEAHELLDVSFFHSEHGVLINLEGRRFVDETVGDHLNTLAVLEQPEARALLICDERVHREWMLRPYVQGIEPIDRFRLAYTQGGRCAVAGDLDELEYLPAEWGYDGATVRAAMERFNRDCVDGRQDPPRRYDGAQITDPPYYVAEVVPAITFTFGGLTIDDGSRVLDARRRAIPGLLAAGADAGGLYFQAYAGGVAAAIVFGHRAAETATGALDAHKHTVAP